MKKNNNNPQISLSEMTPQNIPSYAEIFIETFNSEPWSDTWTEETATKRISGLMSSSTYFGLHLKENEKIVGFILGQKEQFFDGVHFQIQEFCVIPTEQRKGYGTALLKELKEFLKKSGVVSTYLITSKGERTEGYYQKQGFNTSEYMIVMGC